MDYSWRGRGKPPEDTKCGFPSLQAVHLPGCVWGSEEVLAQRTLCIPGFPRPGWCLLGAGSAPGGTWPCSLVFQYAVPVVKYDRKGYKARARQLLLTQSSAIIVEESKIKQRIDYSNLTGGNGTGMGLGTP